MLVSQAHSFTQQARLAITLAWVAGYTNILTVLTCGTVTSHVSGTASTLGRDIVEGSWAAAGFLLYLLGTFYVGAAISGALTEGGRRRGWESIYVSPMLVEAILLTAFAVGVELHDPASRLSGWTLWWLVGAASMAMGLQNATISRISSGVVRTTHVTGVLTDLGSESAQFAYWLYDRGMSGWPRGPREMARGMRRQPSVRRLAVLASIIGSFSFGAGLGTLAFEWIARWAMVPPVLFLLWIIGQDIKVPICEIEESDLTAGGGAQLPAGIAVYHLRKDSGRRGAVQRLPDLLRWCERLPASSRVVILDLGEVTELDANAALEFRALVKQAEGRGRRLVISGVTGRQYRALREAGAGDALDADNVCPDLELAIARGLVLLEDQADRAG
jgi:uncharacterized membrane protein YoaK (UPF0700 family)